MKLVIVESPAKAKTIKKFLGRNYQVMASVGHIRDLPKSKMGVDIKNNFEPQYINIRGKGDIIKELKKTAKKADKVFLATDPDREGEAISFHLANILGLDINDNIRVTFNEITKEKIKQRIKEPRAIDMSLVDSQQGRRVLDRLVGYSISPLLWQKVRRGLSAGRVQSVTTKMICDREKVIESFVKEEYWSINFKLLNNEKKNVPAILIKKDNKDINIKNQKEAEKVVNELKKLDYKVNKISKKRVKRNPTEPFTTSKLQQEASSKLNFSAKKTMMVAQGLYEGINIKGSGTIGLITYMRTDSTRISDEAKSAAIGYIKENFGNEYLKSEFKEKKSSKKIQDAHEAIRPTYTDITPDSIADNLTTDQYKLYKLIWEKFISYYMKPAEFESTTADIIADKYSIRAKGNTLVFDGFLKVYSFNSSKNVLLPKLNENDELKLKEISYEQHFTQPIGRYTEASLVKEMEEKGIGRPSTYAPTIFTIINRGYVKKVSKTLHPTELGFLVNDILEKNFPTVVDILFTANMEKELDDVSVGNKEWKEVIRNFYNPFEKLIEKAQGDIEKIDFTEKTDLLCEKCNNNLVIRQGRFGKFLACSNYPECDFTKSIVDKIGIKCPKCKVGDVIKRRTKKFKIFYGCSEFPNCDFVSWHQPLEKNCEKCGSYLIHYKTMKMDLIKCSNSECDYKEENKSIDKSAKKEEKKNKKFTVKI